MKVDIYFTYDKGQKVVIKESGKVGTIKRREFLIYDNDTKTTVTEKYYVTLGSMVTVGYTPDEIEPAAEFYELKEPDKIQDLLIDVQLKKGDFEFAKRLYDEKMNK